MVDIVSSAHHKVGVSLLEGWEVDTVSSAHHKVGVSL